MYTITNIHSHTNTSTHSSKHTLSHTQTHTHTSLLEPAEISAPASQSISQLLPRTLCSKKTLSFVSPPKFQGTARKVAEIQGDYRGDTRRYSPSLTSDLCSCYFPVILVTFSVVIQIRKNKKQGPHLVSLTHHPLNMSIGLGETQTQE